MQRKKGHTQSLEMGEGGKRALCLWWKGVGWDRVALKKKEPAFLKGRADKCLRWLQGSFLCSSACPCC